MNKGDAYTLLTDSIKRIKEPLISLIDTYEDFLDQNCEIIENTKTVSKFKNVLKEDLPKPKNV